LFPYVFYTVLWLWKLIKQYKSISNN